MILPSPTDLGLPEKFERWRPVQEEMITNLLLSTKRIKAPEAPTGSGKSGAYLGYIGITKRPTVIVTDSLGLMSQILRDAAPLGAVELKGRQQYPCRLKPDYTCEEGRAARCPSHGGYTCPLSQAEFAARTAPIVVTNYAKWTSSRLPALGLPHIEQVVFDEGHLAVDALERSMQIVLYDREIEHGLRQNWPDAPEDIAAWKEWAKETHSLCAESLADLRYQIAISNPPSAVLKLYMRLQGLKRRLRILMTARLSNWIVDRVEKGFQFDPIRVRSYAEGRLFMRLPHVLITSATLRRKSLFDLGLMREDYDYWEYPSDFNPTDCPFTVVPLMRVDRNNRDLTPLWVMLDQLAARRRDRKGIVHPISFARSADLRSYSRFADSMIANIQGDSFDDVVDRFRRSPPGTILVSPSAGAGYDFPGDQCEWQFVCKIPFADSRSRIVKARQDADPEYGPNQAAMKLQQIAGRGARFKGDRCETVIGDAHLQWFYPRYRHLFSKAFQQFYRQRDTLPQPLPKL